MSKKVKVSADKAKQLQEKMKQYKALTPVCKNVIGGIQSTRFERFAGFFPDENLPA
jgi:hypothetical protein